MWSRFNPQRDELLSLCQEAGEQESRVLLMAVSWGRAALPGPWAGALAWPEATPSCQPGRGSAPVLGERCGVVGSLQAARSTDPLERRRQSLSPSQAETSPAGALSTQSGSILPISCPSGELSRGTKEVFCAFESSGRAELR